MRFVEVFSSETKPLDIAKNSDQHRPSRIEIYVVPAEIVALALGLLSGWINRNCGVAVSVMITS